MLPLPQGGGAVLADQFAQLVDRHAGAMAVTNPNVVCLLDGHAAAFMRTTRLGRKVIGPVRGPGFKRQFFLNRS